MLIGGLPLSPGHRIAVTGEELGRMVAEMRAHPSRAFDFESNGIAWWNGRTPIGYSCGYLGDNGQPVAFYVPFGHRTMERQTTREAARAAFRDALEGAEELLGHNAGFDLNMGKADGFDIPEWTPLHDTLIQAYLINENRRFQLEKLAEELGISPYYDGAMGAKNVLEEWLARRAKEWRMGKEAYLEAYGHSEVPVAIEGEYSCRDIGHTLLLDRVQRYDALAAGTWFADRRQVLYTNEMLLVRAIADMAWTGQIIDTDYLRGFGVELDEYLRAAGVELCRTFGATIDWNNDNALRDLLYKHMRLPVCGFTERGEPAVDRSALMSLQSYHPGIGPLVEWRARFKVRSTYTDSLINRVGQDGRIHADFVQWGAGTGRLSGRAPNLQNIPTRHPELGKRVRRAFIVDPGRARVYCDYSQIELRVLGWATGSPALTGAYESAAYMDLLAGRISYDEYRYRRQSEPETDVHANVARTVFGVDPSHPEFKLKRSASKIINFGVPYGGGPNLLMGDPNLRLSENDAKRFFEDYHRANPEIDRTREHLFRYMRANGCAFVNWAGRVRHGPRLAWRRKRGGDCPVAAEERSMFASLIQGSAAELTRFSLVRLWWGQKTGAIPGKTTSTVHDEIARDCDVADIRECAMSTQATMEDFVGMFGTIPVVAGLETTTTDWAAKAHYDPFKQEAAA